MRRRLVLALSSALLVAHLEAQAAPPEVAIEVRVQEPMVEFGQPFPLEVLRRRPADCEAEPWKQPEIPSLTLELLERTESALGGHVEERFAYRASAFALGPLLVPAQLFTVRTPAGGEIVATSLPVHLEVTSALGDRDPAQAEGMQPLRSVADEEAGAGPFWLLYALPALAVLSFLVLRMRRRPASPVAKRPAASATGPAPDPRARAFEALRALELLEVQSADADREFHVRVAELLRETVHAEHGVGAPEQTTREWMHALERAGLFENGMRARLAAALGACDYVKFAARRSDPAQRQALLQDARDLIAAWPAAGETR